MKKRQRKQQSKRSQKGRLMALFMLSLLLAGAVSAGLWLERSTVIQSVQFTGNHFTSEMLLQNATNGLIDLPADSVNFDSIFTELRTLPYVDDVMVRMNRHGSLTFQIREHRPVALLIDRNSTHYLSEKGTLLPVVAGKAANVPLLQGIESSWITDDTQQQIVSETISFLNTARNCEFCWISLSEVGWHPDYGVFALTHEESVKLIFGEKNFEEKLSSWREFYRTVLPERGANSFRTLDLRFRNQIVARQT